MDCMTISTFRSLEQQAIRQYRELQTSVNSKKQATMETFGKEKPCCVHNLPYLNNLNQPNNSINKGINYYA